MRHALTVLIAFAAGVLLTTWWSGHRAAPPIVTHPAAATSIASISETADVPAVADDGGDDALRTATDAA
jgi:hypothetical protein